MQETGKDEFLNQALDEMPEGVLYPEDFYAYIVRRDGSCIYTREEVEAWLTDQDCLE
jgi:hypothetical protein